MRQLFLEGRPLHIFPCRADKRPCTPHGHLDAVSDQASITKLWSQCPGPLVGVATRAISGLDAIDIDLRRGGDQWFHENHNRLPKTRTHETPSGGWHLIFNHLPGLRTSTDRIAPGVEVRANGPHIIWHPANAGRVICDAPPADFPIWVAELGGWNLGGWNAFGPVGVTSEPNDFSFSPPTTYQINYAKRALGNACYELRHCEEGRRNHLLNVLAYKMGRLIARGWINLERVEDYLLRCCEANGLLENDGIGRCRATLASGISAGGRECCDDRAGG